MQEFPPSTPSRSKRWQRNRRHWTENIDAANLADGRDGATLHLDKIVALSQSHDIRIATAWLHPRSGSTILDLGGGLGVIAILLARAGAHVILADISLPRLRQASQLAAQAGLAHLIHPVLCAAEQLPFLDQSLDGQSTKSVLIHTQLPDAAKELARTLRPRGRAAFIEPLDSNPLVNLYRATVAPPIWKEIATYFNRRRLQILSHAFLLRGHTTRIRRLYLLAFLAFVFQFALHAPRLFRFAEKRLLALDLFLFHIAPSLRQYSWFSIVLIGEDHRR